MARRVSISRPGREATERGALAVEFALLVPVLLLLLFGIVDMGAAYQKWSVASNAAREAARKAAVSRDPADIADRARAVAAALDANRTDVAVTCSHDGRTFSTCPAASSWTAGDVVRVSVSYRHAFVTPVGEMLKRDPETTLRATSEVRFEG